MNRELPHVCFTAMVDKESDSKECNENHWSCFDLFNYIRQQLCWNVSLAIKGISAQFLRIRLESLSPKALLQI